MAPPRDKMDPANCQINNLDTHFVPCYRRSAIVVDHGFSGLGACRQHAGQVLLWAMREGYPNGGGNLPQSTVKVYPLSSWLRHKEELAADEQSPEMF
jgi:hypothetical protein